MFTKFLLPIAATALLLFAVWHVAESRKSLPRLPPPITPPQSPFAATLAGAGLIEPETENIAVGSPVAGVVVEVRARVGQHVMPGELLFRLDDRQLRAELVTRKAAVEAARAELTRLEHEPRPERLRMAEAQFKENEAKLSEALDRVLRIRKLASSNAATDEERVSREKAHQVAEALLSRARADLEMTRAGTWQYETEIAQTSLGEAEARLQQTQIEIERLSICALVAGEVLQVNVRPGEFVSTPPTTALIVLGDVQQLHVRVDVDEHDIPRFEPTAAARATLKGQPDRSFGLRFVRVEPYVVPKRSLTGENTERVDTRVLHVIYAVDNSPLRLFVGQQVDVFIDAQQPTATMSPGK